MNSLRILTAFGALAIAVAAPIMSASPAAADQAGRITYYICPNGTVVSVPPGQCTGGVAPKSVVEQPASAPPPTVAAATPPVDIICNLPMVATLHAGTWKCIVPKSTKLNN